MSRFTSLNIQPRKESKKTGRSPRIGVDMTGLSKFLAAHDSFASDGTTFDGLITGGLSTQITSDHLGGLAQVSNLSFSVVNPGLFSDLFNGIDPENERVQTFLYFDDGTSILDAERVQLFDGNISDFPDITYDTVVFQAEPLDVRLNTLIGTLLTDADAADTDLGLPEGSRGKIKPIIYGDHTFLKGNDAKSNDIVSNLNNMTPCIYLGIDSSDNHRWLVANHIVNEINVEGDDSEQQQIWGFDSTLNRMVRLKTTFTVEQNTAAGCIISHASDPEFWDHWYPRGTQNAQNSGDPQITDFDTPANIIDKDFSTFATARMTGVTDQNEWVEVEMLFPPYDNQSISNADITQLDVMIYMETRLTGVTDTDYVVEAKGTAPTTAFTDPSGGSYPDTRLAATMSGLDNLVGIVNPIRIRLTMNNAPVGPGEDIFLDVYQVYKRIQYKRKELMPLYFAGKGKEYSLSINGRSTTEGFTETHADDDGFGNLIENGAGIIESILREDTGFTLVTNGDFAADSDWTKGSNWTIGSGKATISAPGADSDLTQAGILVVGQSYQITFRVLNYNSQTIKVFCGSGTAGTARSSNAYFTQTLVCSGSTALIFRAASGADLSIDDVSITPVSIDLDSFNVSSNDLSTTKLSFAILEQVESNTLLDSILKTLGSIGYYDEQNRFRMRTYVSGDGFGASGTNYPGPEDVIDFSPQTVFKIETGVNDKIDANDSGPAFTATLTAGTYTGDSLATEIEIQLEASGVDNYTVTYSSSTGKFTLLNDTGNWTLEWDTGANTATSTGPMLGFDISADDNGATDTFTSNFPVFGDSLLFHPIIEDTFTLKKVDDDIVTNFTVEYYQEYVNNRFQKTSTVTDTTFHAETLKQPWRHPYTNDTTTAEFYRDFLKVRLRRKHYEGTLVTKLSAVGFEPWDFANVRHPILNGILGNGEENTKWIITDIGLSAETMEYMIGFVES